MLLIKKETINKYKKIQEDFFEELQEKGLHRQRLIEMRNSTKTRDEIKIIDEQLEPINVEIIELSAKSSILRQFIHELLFSSEVR
jgi:predicted RNA-binding protein with PUA domain